MQFLPEALAPLAAYRQFIVYVLVPSTDRPGKTDKKPVDYRTGIVARGPDCWTDAQTAIAAAARFGPNYGVGFEFTEADPFWFVDIDGCRLPDNTWSPIAQALVAAFPGAAVEVSSSCNGLHVIGSGQVPAHGTRCAEYGLEFYTSGRFVALTGINIVGSAGADFTHLMPSLVHQFFPVKGGADGLAGVWTTGPCPEWNGPTDDTKLIERALRSASARAAFGKAAAFRDLWECNVPVLAGVYPAIDGDRPYDSSSVDAALAQHLAFWTGNDCERIKRLMLKSALCRPKWDREDYLPRTILNAVARQSQFLTDKEPEPLASPPVTVPQPPVDGVSAGGASNAVQAAPPRAVTVTGATFLAVDQQIELFQGSVYVTDSHRVLVPGGVLLKSDQFRVMYGGYSFVMDNVNDWVSKDAWEAFTQSQAFRSPRADSTCFKPDRPPGELIADAGRVRVNTWWPVEVPRQVGDVQPFLDHLIKVLPDERDRMILLSYMAACVQYKGRKFQWAPLIQGVEGNGKTLFTRCVAEAVGHRYTHMPPAHEISEKFNSWLFGTLLIGVEDVFVPDQRKEIFEILKPMITSDTLAKRAMNTDQIMADVVCNFMFNTNHKDGIRKTRNDRRIAPLYCAQQDIDDLTRDGMTESYFRKLYTWLKSGGGYAIVSELLHTYPIPDEFNPAGAALVAPITSSTQTAIDAGLGGVEQEIVEAIHQGKAGFCGDWISSIMLDRLIEQLGASRRIQLNKRREMLITLGYELHPGLPDGRVNNPVLPDGGKPRLFIRKDSKLRVLTGPAEIAKAYCEAQMITQANSY